jgi:methanogenic corrinoid protein MtbC1
MRAWTPGRRGAADVWRSHREDPCHAPDPGGEAAPHTHAEALLRTVETEIIPRLMLLHREHSRDLASLWAADSGALVDDATVERFTDAVLAGQARALEVLQEIAGLGVPATRLCLDLLAPTARRLGDLWSADVCDFTQVTIALGRLHALVHRVTQGMHMLRAPVAAPRSVVFASAPGEQHTLGLAMVRDFFRAAGWQVDSDAPETPQALLALLRRRRVDLVGFTIGSERHVPTLAALIADVRRVSLHRGVRVMVGGPLLLARADLVNDLGADATADDASRAILVAHELVIEQD